MFSWQLSAKSPSEMEGGRERGREGEREGKREREVEREGGRGEREGRERRDHLQVLMIGSRRRRLAAALTLLCFLGGASLSGGMHSRVPGGHGHGSPAPRQCAGGPSASLTRLEGCALPHPPGTPWGRARATKLPIPTDARLRSRLKPTQPGRAPSHSGAQLQQRPGRARHSSSPSCGDRVVQTDSKIAASP